MTGMGAQRRRLAVTAGDGDNVNLAGAVSGSAVATAASTVIVAGQNAAITLNGGTVSVTGEAGLGPYLAEQGREASGGTRRPRSRAAATP